MIYKYFSYFVDFLFYFPDGFLLKHWSFSFWLSSVDFLFCHLCFWCHVIHLRNYCLAQGHRDLLLCFLLRTVLVLTFRFWSVSSYLLVMVWGRGSTLFISMWIFSCPMLAFMLKIKWPKKKKKKENQMTIIIKIYFCTFNFILP